MNGGSVVEAQLRSLRAQCLAFIALIDLILEPTPAQVVGCQHPETRNVGTMGHPARQCTNPSCLAVIETQPKVLVDAAPPSGG